MCKHSALLLAAACGMLFVHSNAHGQRALSDLPGPVSMIRSGPRITTMSRQEEQSGPRSTIPGFQLGAGVGTGLVSSGDLYGLSEFSVSLAKDLSDDEAGAAYVLVQHSPLRHTSRLNESLDGGVTIIGLAADYRFYRTPSYTAIGHYLGAGVALQALFWEYLNELQLPQYDDQDVFIGYERVKHDVLFGFDVHGAIGIDIGQVWDFHIEGEISPGLMFWSGKSQKGFNNTIFKPFFYLKGRVMARIAL